MAGELLAYGNVLLYLRDNLKNGKVEKTAVIILEYNNSADTINCIESVMRHNSAPIKFVVVDNGSSNKEEPAALDAYFKDRFSGNWISLGDNDKPSAPLPYLTFLKSAANDGYARGNNKALALVDADDEIGSVLILNSDILFVDDIIPSLRKALEAPHAGIVSPVLFKKGMKELDGNCARRALSASEVVWMYFPFPYDALRIGRRRRLGITAASGLMPIDLPSGSCMLLRKDVFKRLGWFDAGTFLYFEEDILFEKIKKVGLQNYLDTACRCIHLGASTIKRTPSKFSLNSSFDSAAYYLKKFKHANQLQLSLLGLFRCLVNLKISLRYKLKQ